MSVELCERTAMTSGRVDRERGIAPDMKMSGLESLNGRKYTSRAFEQALSLFEGAACFIDHGGASQDRSFRDRFGVWRRVHFVPGDGLRGDLHFNPRHDLAEQFIWALENSPEQGGFSIRAYGHGRQVGDVYLVEEITAVRSVDLVAQPATTQSFLECTEDGHKQFRAARCRLADAWVGRLLPRSSRAFARRLIESADVFGVEQGPSPAAAPYLQAASKLVFRTDLSPAERAEKIGKLLDAAAEAEGSEADAEKTIQDILGPSGIVRTSESYRPRPSALPRDAREFAERVVTGPSVAELAAFAERITR